MLDRKTSSHYSSKGMNLKKVVPKSRSRDLDGTGDTLALNEELVGLKKLIKQQEKQAKKQQATINRLTKINSEKDRLLDENHGQNVKNYGASLNDPVALRKRVAK